MDDVRVYSPEHLLEQAGQSPLECGYHRLKFFIDQQKQLAKHDTGLLADFYYSPSGGTLRDAELNIVLYSAKFDRFKAFGRAT